MIVKNFQLSFQDITDAIEASNSGKILPLNQIKANVKKAYEGKERVIQARLLGVEALMGRAKVVDLQVQFDSQQTNANQSSIRLIDLRNLNWVIYKGVKYSKKK